MQALAYNHISYCRDQLRGEILFLLYKISSLEGGIEELLPFLSNLIYAAINALVKSESDDLRMNCIALLKVLAQKSVLSIGFQPKKIGAEDFMEHGACDFARDFAEALKGSLISSDSQVQIAALELLVYMCPSGNVHTTEIEVLIEAGIMDYLFELLRLSDMSNTMVPWAVRVLSILSEANDAFKQRFAIGLETLNWVLKCSLETALLPMQTDVLNLIHIGLTNYLGAIPCVSVEQILRTIVLIFQHSTSDNISLEYDSFNTACSACLALLRLPCVCSIREIESLLSSAVSSTFFCVSMAGLVGLEHRMLKHAVLLLKEVFSVSVIPYSPTDSCLIEVIINTIEVILLPFFLKNLALIEDEDTVRAVLEVLVTILDQPNSVVAWRLSDNLAAASWISVTYELMARFTSCSLRHLIMNLLGSLICVLERGNLDENIKNQFSQLPSDPHDVLVLLALSSVHDQQLKLIQFGIIKILYYNHIYGDRFAEGHTLACLDQYLLLNSSMLSPNFCSSLTIKQLICVYVCTMQRGDACDVPHSLEAENFLASVVDHCRPDLISSNMHRSVFSWLIRSETLQSFMATSTLDWIKAVGNAGRAEKLSPSPVVVDHHLGIQEDFNFSLLAFEEDYSCGPLFCRVLDEVLAGLIEDEIRIVVTFYIKLVKFSTLAANQLVMSGLVSNIRSWIAINRTKLEGVFCYLIELLHQLLCAVDCDKIFDEEPWNLLVEQFIYILADKLSMCVDAAVEELLSQLNIMSLVLHKSSENPGFLMQASGMILSNEQLQNAVASCLAISGSHNSKLLKLTAYSTDGKLLACLLAFHKLCLRCAIRNLTPNIYYEKSSQYPLMLSVQEDLSVTLQSIYKFVLPRSLKESQSLCKLLYFGPEFVKVLASFCLVELFYWITQSGTVCSEDEGFDTNKYQDVFQSIVMVLQCSILDSNEFVSKNSSVSLYYLLIGGSLSSYEKKILHFSPWHRFLLEDFVSNIMSPNLENVSMPATIYAAIGILKQEGASSWIRSVLSPCISTLVCHLANHRMSPAILVLLKELHVKGWLETKHSEEIHKNLQSLRKIVYGEKRSSNSCSYDPWHNSCASFCSKDSDAECLVSYRHIMNLAASHWLDPLIGVQHHKGDQSYNSKQFVSLIDEFLQETVSTPLGKP
ncbi:hypothetical protein KP509_01G119100 [Ceratopteris richardii]|uniref:Uncharacterized protein n=1 Tax=Ceratopteris richardii TaxID=49495 RepID=A0A8T2VKX0_CERRI|nr:hypothetical protein KP509_01G119100 [Ceratopteris richardii]